jgi:NAD(P)-dependent dehydrogenase (short-subunit alcohol dehydrogenase family)
MGKLEAKVSLITGAASGIGRATALLFAKEGAKVAVADCNLKGGQETVRAIKEAGGEAIFVKVDVSNAADVEGMVKTVMSTYGRIDILHNDAAIQGPFGAVTEVTEEDWDKVIDINLKGTYLVSKHVIPVMLRQGGGVVINMASTAGIVGIPFTPAYCAAKGGVIQLTKSMALAYAAQNIRVNAVCPGGTLTPMMEGWLPTDPRERQAFLEGMPGGRPILPEEIARAVLFLACDDASAAVGSVLVLDLGHTAA